jgi:hypothetical protein
MTIRLLLVSSLSSTPQPGMEQLHSEPGWVRLPYISTRQFTVVFHNKTVHDNAALCSSAEESFPSEDVLQYFSSKQL